MERAVVEVDVDAFADWLAVSVAAFEVGGQGCFGSKVVARCAKLVDGDGEVALGSGDVPAGSCLPVILMPFRELIHLAGGSLLCTPEGFEVPLGGFEIRVSGVGLGYWPSAVVDEGFAECFAVPHS